MNGFPKGLTVLLVDVECDGPAAQALRNPELAYCVTPVTSLEAAQASFKGGIAAYDVVVCEHSLLTCPSAAQAFFRAAAAVHAPVVLMGESPSQAAVLQGVHWGAADFLERPLSMLKLRTLWQHKIRKMMERGNGGVLPRRPSCPQLPSLTSCGSEGALAGSGGGSANLAAAPMLRCGSLPGLSCPATPSLLSVPLAAPQTSSSLASEDSGCQQGGCQPGNCGAVLPTTAGERSDATSGMPRAQPMNLMMEPLLPAQAQALQGPQVAAAPAGPAAPLACLRLGASAEAMPATVVHWPALPSGVTWGTPVGCGVPPPPLPGSPAAAAAPPPPGADAFPQPTIKWCPPGSLPLPATTYDLLLPEDFSLARVFAEAGDSGTAGTRGPLGLRLTVTPELLASFNASLQAHRPQHTLLKPAALASAPAT